MIHSRLAVLALLVIVNAPGAWGRCMADVGLLLDNSQSITKDLFELITKPLVSGLKDYLPIDYEDVRIGVVTFNDTGFGRFFHDMYLRYYYTFLNLSRVILPLAASFQQDSAINSLREFDTIVGPTCVACGIQTLTDSLFDEGNGDRKGIKNFAIAITDGVSSIHVKSAITQARRLLASGAEVWVIQIRGQKAPDTEVIQAMASSPDNIVEILEPGQLPDAFRRLASSICPGFA
ncbi:hypothetical protein CAPTEDRAFT_219872 [Capitella teleta]|uniref:VWFA domain-containing protein n=1 Tax=Capitella teleta TaxID=283909 RepID=R7UCV9_CAPTE|nr:hypothetical protein CAPTEDRAFT_219872 [Capitella teleta]|eukprot:ELU04225.1 hypothetical protein CAPTEDRAFT_219872 [Capitella teleta]